MGAILQLTHVQHIQLGASHFVKVVQVGHRSHLARMTAAKSPMEEPLGGTTAKIL